MVAEVHLKRSTGKGEPGGRGCKLHPNHSKLDSLELGCVWKHLFKNNLNVKAQTDVIVHSKFAPYLNRKASIQPIDLIFSATQQK